MITKCWHFDVNHCAITLGGPQMSRPWFLIWQTSVRSNYTRKFTDSLKFILQKTEIKIIKSGMKYCIFNELKREKITWYWHSDVNCFKIIIGGPQMIRPWSLIWQISARRNYTQKFPDCLKLILQKTGTKIIKSDIRYCIFHGGKTGGKLLNTGILTSIIA